MERFQVIHPHPSIVGMGAIVARAGKTIVNRLYERLLKSSARANTVPGTVSTHTRARATAGRGRLHDERRCPLRSRRPGN